MQWRAVSMSSTSKKHTSTSYGSGNTSAVIVIEKLVLPTLAQHRGVTVSGAAYGAYHHCMPLNVCLTMVKEHTKTAKS